MSAVRAYHHNKINKISIRRASESQGQSIFSPLEQVDGYAAKAALAALIVLDKASFISPIRWFLPTASDDGKSLKFVGVYGCGGDQLKTISDQPNKSMPTPAVCSKDTDC